MYLGLYSDEPRDTSTSITLDREKTMPWDDDKDTSTYKVVINHEEQYSIWPEDREVPLGWKDAGKSGTKQECLDYIEEVWTDMRPLSLRKQMEKMAREAAKKDD